MSKNEILNNLVWESDFSIDITIMQKENKFFVFYNSAIICEIKHDSEIFINGDSCQFTVHSNNYQIVMNNERLPYLPEKE